MSSGIAVSFVNKRVKHLRVRKALYRDQNGQVQEMDFLNARSWLAPNAAAKNGKIQVYVEADYYMQRKSCKEGHGIWMNLSVRNR